jgi:hypothetical protein
MHFATRVRKSRFFLHFSLCPWQHLKCELSIRLVYPIFFCKLRSSSDPTNKNLREKGLEIQQLCLGKDWKLYICSYNFFFIMTDRYYHLAKYWPFLLNHPVWIIWSATIQTRRRETWWSLVHYYLPVITTWIIYDLLFSSLLYCVRSV